MALETKKRDMLIGEIALLTDMVKQTIFYVKCFDSTATCDKRTQTDTRGHS